MAKPKIESPLLPSSSLMMACLFAYSASVQLDDPDWYFWLPLYALASAVNLLSIKYNSRNTTVLTKSLLWSGILLFLKVSVEGNATQGMADFWSLDMGERVVREKLGSALVVISMFLQLQASKIPKASKKGRRGADASSWTAYGMAALGAGSFGLFFWFSVFVKDIRK